MNVQLLRCPFSQIHLHLGDSLFSKATYNHSCIHSRLSQPGRVTASSSEHSEWGVLLGRPHLDNQLRNRGDRTSNIPLTSQPALPPELLSKSPKTLFPTQNIFAPKKITGIYKMHLHVIWCKHEHKWVVGLCRKIEQLTNFYANLTTILIPQLSHPYSTA